MLPSLTFQPYLRPMIWGGRRLQTLLGRRLPDEGTYGESWEISDHHSHVSVVAEGSLAGWDLRRLMSERSEELLGPTAIQHSAFPWLVKFIDAQQPLSVQVHPDDEKARLLAPNERGKTEAWYILHADAGSRIYAGLKTGVNEETLRDALRTGTVADLLHSFEPRAGDCVFIPAGTVHAIGAGIVLAEIQQTSDATFRLFDWNRVDAEGKPRPLHIEESIACIDWNRGPVDPIRSGQELPQENAATFPLVECPFFSLELTHLVRETTVPPGAMQVWIILNGSGTLYERDETIELRRYGVWLLPHTGSERRVVPEQPLTILQSKLPNQPRLEEGG